jgi:hypothetical protein
MKRLEAVIERAAAPIARSRNAINRSAARMRTSEALIFASQRRLVPELRGSALAEESSEPLRKRVREVMATVSGIPTVFAGPGMGTTACTVCRREITGGTTEYEMVFESRVIILDRKCFALWQTEQAPN